MVGTYTNFDTWSLEHGFVVWVWMTREVFTSLPARGGLTFTQALRYWQGWITNVGATEPWRVWRDPNGDKYDAIWMPTDCKYDKYILDKPPPPASVPLPQVINNMI